MNFDGIENSAIDSAPEELYAFAIGSRVTRVTSARSAITYDGDSYQPAAISRGEISDVNTMDKAGLTITAHRTLEVLDQYISGPPAQLVTVTVLRKQYDPIDEEDLFRTIWKGRVVDVAFSGEKASITCESIFKSMARRGLTPAFQKRCRHSLYDEQCGVGKGAYRHDTEVDTVSGLQVTAASLASFGDGYFSGGFITYSSPGVGATVRHYIKSHSGNKVVLGTYPFNLEAGDEIKVYPGCNKTIATCGSKFNNVARYGGVPYTNEKKNPFDGAKVF